MRVDIEPATDINIRDVVKRSPVKNVQGAEDQLRRFLLLSVCAWAGSINGKVACVWGIVSPTLLNDAAYLWLITTDLVDEHPFIFVRHSQIVIQKMLKEYPVIRGHVVADAERSIRWLRWLGVKLKKHRGEGGMIEFELKAS